MCAQLTGGPDLHDGLSPTVLAYSRTSTESNETLCLLPDASMPAAREACLLPDDESMPAARSASEVRAAAAPARSGMGGRSGTGPPDADLLGLGDESRSHPMA